MKRKEIAAHKCESCQVITKSRIAVIKGQKKGYAYMCAACKRKFGLDQPRAM